MDLKQKIEERIAYLRQEENKAIKELDRMRAGTIERAATWETIRELHHRRRELEEILKP